MLRDSPFCIGQCEADFINIKKFIEFKKKINEFSRHLSPYTYSNVRWIIQLQIAIEFWRDKKKRYEFTFIKKAFNFR